MWLASSPRKPTPSTVDNQRVAGGSDRPRPARGGLHWQRSVSSPRSRRCRGSRRRRSAGRRRSRSSSASPTTTTRRPIAWRASNSSARATGSARRTSCARSSRSRTAGSSGRATSARATSARRRFSVGPAAMRFPAVQLPDIQAEPEVGESSVRFVQTIGGRMGLPTPRPVPHPPFVQFWPSIAWTTLALTINADGSSSHELVGASPFPRHWIYDDDGRAWSRSPAPSTSGSGSTTRTAIGRRGARRTRRRSVPRSSRRSSAPCRARSCAAAPSRRSGRSRRARTSSGRARPGTDVFLILDGIFVVEVDDDQVAEIGPGAVVGERAAMSNGTRTATLWARTPGPRRERAVCRARPGGPRIARGDAPTRSVGRYSFPDRMLVTGDPAPASSSWRRCSSLRARRSARRRSPRP